jgi:hypothetical protein
MNTDERKLTGQIRRHHPFNQEWWTPARKVKGWIIGLGVISATVLSTFGAIDMLDNRCVQPIFDKRCEKWYAPKHKIDSAKNANAQFRNTMELMKVNNGLEVLLTEEERNVRDVHFKHDSITYIQGQKGE